jgi:hypothetical protein
VENGTVRPFVVCKCEIVSQGNGKSWEFSTVKRLQEMTGFIQSENPNVGGHLGDLSIDGYLILPAALGPGVYSASNRNEYQKH